MKLIGQVIKGEGLGFKTANLKINHTFTLENGVYLAKVYYQNQEYQAIAIMGVRQDIEVYLLDFNGDLYGQVLEVEIIQKLRDLIKFKRKKDLLKQIKRDVDKARVYFTDKSLTT
jgi:riboflavin kinase/FMN adenylyltransferase